MRKYKENEYERFIQAKCPLCANIHETLLYWTGEGTPRVYCPECRLKVAGKSLRKETTILLPANTRRNGSGLNLISED